MTKSRQAMIDAMVLRGFSTRTHRSYLDAIAGLAMHYHRSPNQLSTDEIQRYFLYLVKDRPKFAQTGREIANFFFLKAVY